MTTFLAILFIITLQCMIVVLLMVGGSYMQEHGVKPADITVSLFLMALIGLLTVFAWWLGRP